jgi:hypothetical protein
LFISGPGRRDWQRQTTWNQTLGYRVKPVGFLIVLYKEVLPDGVASFTEESRYMTAVGNPLLFGHLAGRAILRVDRTRLYDLASILFIAIFAFLNNTRVRRVAANRARLRRRAGWLLRQDKATRACNDVKCLPPGLHEEKSGKVLVLFSRR